MNKILILGATSFSGISFANHLSEQWKPVMLGRNVALPGVFNAFHESKWREVQFIPWNINENQDHIIELVRNEKIKTVVNFAAQSMVGQSWEFPEDWYEANLLSFSTLIKGLANLGQIEKFIQFTTPEVYGSTNGWVKESFNFAPNTPYAISRAASDWHLRALFENFDFPVIFTRAANVYGEHQRLYRLIPRVIISALIGKKLPLQGGGKSIRSFIHIDDVSDALLKIIEGGTLGSTYHISSNEVITVHDLVEMIAAKLNVRFEDLVEIAPERAGKDFAYQLDSEKIRNELDWKDRISLDSGLDRTINWVHRDLEELKNHPLDYEHKR
jgi:dTDP-glucose 4,6-dehydratase